LVDGYREINKGANQSTSEDDSFGSTKADEKETARNS
jgi:hypothetical protein